MFKIKCLQTAKVGETRITNTINSLSNMLSLVPAKTHFVIKYILSIPVTLQQ